MDTTVRIRIRKSRRGYDYHFLDNESQDFIQDSSDTIAGAFETLVYFLMNIMRNYDLKILQKTFEIICTDEGK